MFRVTGWVRNRGNGSVEVEAEGERRAVEDFIDELKAGPRLSHVESTTVDWISPRHDTSFEVTR
jgi:acylphosphatase